MDKEGFFYLGKIIKPFGSKGHVVVVLEVDNPGRYNKLDSVFVGIGGDHIPFFIETVELKSDQKAILKIEDINSPEQADILTGKELFLPMESLPKRKGKKFYHHEVTGYTVIDEHHGDIGIVESIIEMPQNELLRIMKGKKEILV